MFNIPLRVKNLVRKYDTCNPYQLAEDLNIDILELDLPEAIRGFFVRPLRRKMIVINANLDDTEKLVVLCHELGHVRLHKGYGMLMHKNLPYYRSTQREYEANEFALHLLSYSHDIDTTQIQSVLNHKKPDAHYIHYLLTSMAND